VRDAKHAGPNGLDDRKAESFTITEPKSSAQADQPPIINDLIAAQSNVTAITWTANATDPENDPIIYRFFFNNKTVTDWIKDNKWILNTSDADVGNNTIEVQIRDGKHEGIDRYDDSKTVQFTLSSMKLLIQRWMTILGAELANSVLQANDGGYVIVGGAPLSGGDNSYAWMGKIDANGKKLWYRTFDVMNGASEVQKTSDGGYIIAGDHGLIKTDADGNKLWNKAFSGPERVSSVQQTKDGGYIIAGDTGGSYLDVWLIKTDADGNKLWDKTFGGPDDDFADSVQQTSDGGYILSGETYSYDKGFDKTWLIKTYSSGNEEWDRILPGTSGGSVRQTTMEDISFQVESIPV
jgi:hypothetical protein